MKMKAKEPLLAVLLSLIFAGVGQIYAGKAKKGLIFLSISLSISIIAPICLVAYLLQPDAKIYLYHLLLIPCTIGFALFVLMDAYKSAKAWNLQHNLERKITAQRRILLIVGILLLIFGFNPTQLVVIPIAYYIRANVAQAFKIPTGAMRPTLMEGDRVLVDLTTYKRSEPKRGDIIVFKYPQDQKKVFLKRVIAFGGERVKVEKGQILINGEKLNEPEGISKNYYYNRDDWPFGKTGQEVPVPLNHYFVLGDNSIQSSDSRNWGFVPKENLIGKAYKVYWPPDRSGRLD